MSCFLRSLLHPELGIGKLLSRDEERVEIEYFDSPTSMERHAVIVGVKDVRRVRLDSETRVYFLDSTSGFWRSGRVADHMEDNICHISMPNQQLVSLHEKDVYTRWNCPIDDPSEHLAARLTETTYFHGPRAALLAEIARQRSAVSGLSGLLSSPVSLERHQVEVVRRVLEDPVQRYLLADEVGLGKTIEAGIILRQYILDHPEDHAVLIITPEALVEQWEEELFNRCRIGKDFGHQIDFVSLEALNKDPSLLTKFKVGYAVIDEAHQAVTGWHQDDESELKSRFEAVSAFCNPSNTPRLLLLSATPVRRNEDGFLALLHLLDPSVYDLGQSEVFRKKVEQRQELANIFHTFTEDEDGYFLEEMVNSLSEMFPSDSRLDQLFDDLKPLLDFSVDIQSPERRSFIRSIRVHLSETYRLHRRLLRNRRSKELDGLLPGREGLTTVEYEDDLFNEVEDHLEAWRLAALEAVFGDEDSEYALKLSHQFSLFLDLAYCDVCALAYLLSSRLGLNTVAKKEWGVLINDADLELVKTTKLFHGEQKHLKVILETVSASSKPYELRFDVIDDIIRKQFKNDFRVIVFVSSPSLAYDLCRFLKELHTKEHPIYRHSSDDSDWCAFREPNNKGVLVCDYRAEEGLNLQGGRSCILHADLPMSPNRIEQRMGRLDRFGVGKSVVSLNLIPKGCGYHKAWHDCLNDAYEVFSRSIAALQYVVEDETRKMRELLFSEGEQAIEDSRSQLMGEEGLLRREQKDILAQDELDAIDVRQLDEESDLTHRIEELEEDEGKIQYVFEAWLRSCLKFIHVGENDPRDRVVRYHYASSNSRRPTLVSAHDFVSRFEPTIERGAVHSHFGSPLTWAMSFYRETSRCRNVGIARIGNPLVDCLSNYLRWDDRGTAFAFWRHSHLIPKDEVRIYFRFDYFVEIGDLSESSHSEDLSSMHLHEIRRRGDSVFPPIVRSIWISEDMEVVDGEILDELTPEYAKGPRDKNLHPQRWQTLEGLDIFNLDEWSDLCRMARNLAAEALVEQLDLRDKISSSVTKQEEEISIVRGQFESRIEALGQSSVSTKEVRHAKKELKEEMSIRDALIDGTKSPKLRLDAAGAVFLAGRAFS